MKGSSQGFSVVEIVVAAAIIVSLVTAASSAWQLFFKVSRTDTQSTQAGLLSEEAMEALNLYRDMSWSGMIAPLSLGTTYYIYWNGSSYSTSTSPITVNGSYVVGFALSSASRNANGDIVSSGGTLDSHTRMAIVSVALSSATSTPILQSSFVIHDVFQN